MSNIVVTPDVVRRIEDNLEYKIVDSWRRRTQGQWWKRVMKTRQSMSKRDIVQWMLSTAKIRPLGNGGNLTYDDIVEVLHEFAIERYGVGLRLTTDDVEDGAELDRAGQWANHVGNYAAEWPQIMATKLLKGGKTLPAYDQGVFFRVDHPVNQYVGVGAGQYPNIHYDMPFTPENLAKAFGIVAQIKAPDGLYRKLKPRIVAAGELERLAVVQALGAEFFADPVRSGTTASAQNVIKTTYGFEEPIIDPEFDETGTAYYNNTTGLYQGATASGGTLKARGVWYLICDLVEDDEMAGLVFSEGKPFELNTFAPLDDVVLAQMDAWEWQFKGRNGATFGHPFLVHRFEPNPSSGPV
jgi:hypothetical protein